MDTLQLFFSNWWAPCLGLLVAFSAASQLRGTRPFWFRALSACVLVIAVLAAAGHAQMVLREAWPTALFMLAIGACLVVQAVGGAVVRWGGGAAHGPSSLDLDGYWVYVAWLFDESQCCEEDDGEYPAVILIQAASASEAQALGDRLYSEVLSEGQVVEFLHSEVQRPDDEMYSSSYSWDSSVEVYWRNTPRYVPGSPPPASDLF